MLRQHGEAYRTTLERLAEQLGVRDHVVFRDQYVTTEELCSYLQAADVFVSPYLNEAQVTSGALSYAMGAGRGGGFDAVLARAKSCCPTGAAACSRSGTAPALAANVAALFDEPAELARVRVRRLTSTRAPSPGPRWARQHLRLGEMLERGRERARRRREEPTRPAACPSCAWTT